MSAKSIYSLLRAAGMTREGACAMMGNMMAESALRSNNAEDCRQVDDESYTAAADNGLNDFVGDGVGYGLCQWTKASRKRKLLAYAKSLGVSVADEDMQARFCVRELRADFPAVWELLAASHDLTACTREILNVYENPAVKNLGTRLEYARQAAAYFDLYGEEPPERSGDGEMDPSVAVMQLVMRYNGCWDTPDGRRSPEFFASLRRFVDELEAG